MDSRLMDMGETGAAPVLPSNGCLDPGPGGRPARAPEWPTCRRRDTAPLSCRPRRGPPARLLDTPTTPQRPPPAPQHLDDTDARDDDQGLLCTFCRHPVTHPRERIVRAGAHEHGRINPAGFSFHLACFAAAPGVVAMGPATLEHTWFAGYGWRVALCGGCGEQLGWRFEAADGDRFFGLIVGRLLAGDGPGP